MDDIHCCSSSCANTTDVQVIELDPSSYLGYEMKHVALYEAQHYGEAIEAFEMMLSKLDCGPDTQKQSKLHITHVSIDH